MINLLKGEVLLQRQILDNGIILINNYDNDLPVANISIFLKMGSIYEKENESGISNLVQTLLLKGTKNRTSEQIAQEIEIMGASISASSTYDYSEISCSSLKENFEQAVSILADVFFNPIFLKEELEKEKVNVIASIISRKDNIFSTSLDNLLFALYKKHPYGRLEDGDINSIKKIKKENLVDWWSRFFGVDKAKKNIIIVISGDINFEESKILVEKYFKEIKQITLPPIINKEIKLNKRVIKKKSKFKQSYIMYGYLSKEFSVENIKEYIALKILNTYLGGGMSSKLFTVLREENPLCYETNSFYPTRLLKSHFVVYIGLDKNNIGLARKKIEEIISEIKSGKMFDENDLVEAKRKLKGRYLLDHQTVVRRAWYLGFWELLGIGYDFDSKYLEIVDHVVLSDVRKVANDVFSSSEVILELIGN